MKKNEGYPVSFFINYKIKESCSYVELKQLVGKLLCEIKKNLPETYEIKGNKLELRTITTAFPGEEGE